MRKIVVTHGACEVYKVVEWCSELLQSSGSDCRALTRPVELSNVVEISALLSSHHSCQKMGTAVENS